MKKICQSCAMPLYQGQADKRGTEINGSRSDEYCNYCYLNGKFQDESMTYEKMLKLCLNTIESSKINKIQKWFYRKSYPKILKNLKRWRN